MAIKLISKLNKLTNDKLSINILFEAPTVKELLNILKSSDIRYKIMIPIQENGSKQPIYAVPGISGLGLGFKHLSEALGIERPFYTFQSNSFSKNIPLQNSIEEIAELYILRMKKTSKPPYHILGFSFGCLIAYEMAYQLKDDLSSLVLLDMVSPSIPVGLIESVKMKSKYLFLTWRDILHGKRQFESVIHDKSMRKFMLNNYSLLYKYTPKPMDIAISCHIIIATNNPNKSHYLKKEQWQELFLQNKVIFGNLNTTHNLLLNKDNAKELATMLDTIYNFS